jgi:hypothetical protein
MDLLSFVVALIFSLLGLAVFAFADILRVKVCLPTFVFFFIAVIFILLVLCTLLLTETTMKAVFIWLALLGLAGNSVVVLKGLSRK